MFSINDFVIYKKSLCKVKDIFKKNDVEYYLLIPIDDDSLKIELPTSNEKFIRKLISKEEVEDVIARIPAINAISTTNPKLIEAEYKKLFSSGSYDDLISIIKTTYLRNEERANSKKKISEVDSNYFKKAEHTIYSEFSVALGLSYDETKDYVISRVSKLDN